MLRPFLLALLAALPAAAAEPPRPPVVRSVAFSPDGNILVAAIGRREQPGAVAAWDSTGREMLWQLRGPKHFASVSFAADGKEVAVACNTPTALRLDPATGRVLGEVGPHPVAVRACAYVPGSGLLATGSDDTIRLWDVTTGTVAKKLQGGHPAEVHGLAFSPDGKWLVSTGPDGTRFWDVAAGVELKGAVKQERGRSLNGPAFVAADRVLFGTNSLDGKILELPTGKELFRYQGYGDWNAYSPKAGLAAYSRFGSDIRIMDLAFRDPTDAEWARIESLLTEFDSDSYETRLKATEAMRKMGSVAEPALRKAEAEGPSAEVRMRARECRRTILETPLRTLTGHTAEVIALVFAPAGAVLASGGVDGTVRLWDARTGKELARLDAPDPIAK